MIMDAAQDALEMQASAQDSLKQAYLFLSFGRYQEAIDACDAAARLAPKHPLAPTLKGSFEMSVGRVGDALGTLRAVTRRHPKYPLAWLYFAEACFLDGRSAAAQRALSELDKLPLTDALLEFRDELVQVWSSVARDVIPPPLVADIS